MYIIEPRKYQITIVHVCYFLGKIWENITGVSFAFFFLLRMQDVLSLLDDQSSDASGSSSDSNDSIVLEKGTRNGRVRKVRNMNWILMNLKALLALRTYGTHCHCLF